MFIDTGTYYVVELNPSKGYQLCREIHEVEVTDENTVYNPAVIECEEPVEQETYLCLKKSSANPDLTDGNDCYSLEGAEYGVYEYNNEAQTDTNRVATLTTDADGNTEAIQIEKGHYFVKELKASKGYQLCGEPHEIDVTDDNNADSPALVECAEPPANDPFALTLNKLDPKNGGDPQGSASLKGAIFALEYYTNTDGSTDGDAFKTWYFMTDEDGKLYCDNINYLANDAYVDTGEGIPDDTGSGDIGLGDGADDLGIRYTLHDKDGNEIVLVSDALYTDENGNVVYPVGTYRIYEVSPPEFYKLEGSMSFKDNPDGKSVTTGLKVVIEQDENGDPYVYDGDNLVDSRRITAENLAIDVYDDVQTGSITIYKTKSDGSKEPLPGVTFRLVGLDEGDEHTVTTDDDGMAVFGSLSPQDYVLTEAKTVEGYSLLKDNIEVTLPMAMTMEEIEENGADIDQSVYDEASGKYCFYDLTYHVGNTVTFQMPLTGGGQDTLYLLLAAGLAIVAAGAWMTLRKNKITG